MRLTVDLILQSPQYLSPSKNWTISMRGCKIDVVENLGSTGDNFECIDLSDNEIIKLSNFPPLEKLHTLIVCNNRVSRIDADFCEQLPNLVSLVLTNNKMERLSDLQSLFKAKKLQRLSLVDNPVCSTPYYRAYLIYNLPSLRFLDFKKIREEERTQARETFSGEHGEKLLQEIAPHRKVTKQTIQRSDGDEGQPLTPEQLDAIKAAIGRATSLEEVARLEAALKEGRAPADLFGKQNEAMQTDGGGGA